MISPLGVIDGDDDDDDDDDSEKSIKVAIKATADMTKNSALVMRTFGVWCGGRSGCCDVLLLRQ